MSTLIQRGILIRTIALVAIGFGFLTIKSGGMILFGNEAARAAGGNYVPFVLWFNFVAGFAYVAGGVGLWMQMRWSAWLSIIIATATGFIFAALGVYIYSDGVYEYRTVIAMSLRTLVWLVIAIISWYQLLKLGSPHNDRIPEPARNTAS